MPRWWLRQFVSAIFIPSAPPWRWKAQVCTGTWNTSWQSNAVICPATKLVQGNVGLENQPRDEPGTSRILEYTDSPSKGWALKSSAVQRKRFNESQKQYLTKLFDVGEQTGHKVDANNVSQSMRKARNIDGSLMFKRILSRKANHKFFFSYSAKKKGGKSRRFRRRGWRGAKRRMHWRSFKKYYQRNWSSSSHNVWFTQPLQTGLELKACKVFHVNAARHMQLVWTGHLINNCKEEEAIHWLNVRFNWQLHLSKVIITFLRHRVLFNGVSGNC